ncbi:MULTISPECIES: HNH endonuclease [unclassified Pseudomonas]|uniref:HNH endonuclease n=1 Tax=unclassified Pseudomonas TaxID=196821 RepID=UPI000BDB8AC6|nr:MULTISPECIES: HNH endonuclease [unclassified Pseudomonas]PVZ12619.1 uncharacterized protein (TIGR02646 family) [Pseudomonas sp. URIL14HWK12:I12]PVZ23230.1 uncharacterized protein (TIGR02646 family) [Pseudomonas sp. URIL14HWK12:I10]PVZ32559.1 uncharacterized protein (TIGR02646 family) [Pseudomonas sp. URIL14HWK12:I11]SNZ13666.1 TIGR02646 family protein [Pseudomonas sp. URIL14HWK12:I9]
MLPIQFSRPIRRTNIEVKSRYSLYKVELRVDFLSKCGYCDTLDYYSGGTRGFHIDHFAPKSKFSSLVNDYSNLVYCCPICNIGKSDDWPGTSAAISFIDEKGYIDPCHTDYHNHLARNLDGSIIPLTPLGKYIHKKLKLNLRRRQICWLLERMEQQLTQLAQIVKDSDEKNNETKALCDLTLKYFEYVGMLKSE